MSWKSLFGCLLCAAVILSPAAIRAEEPPQANRSEIEKTIRAYLLAHPEILVEMSQTLQRRQQEAERAKSQATLHEKRAELVADASSPVAGQPSDAAGAVTIVEFFDYRCGYCKKVSPLVRKLADEDPTIRVVFKEFPILGPESSAAAMAALAAHEQGGYLKFHQALMSSTDLSMNAIERLASEAGLDVTRLKADMAKPEVQAALARNRALGEALAIQATPAFVIGREVVPGALDEASMRRLIAKARADAKVKAATKDSGI